MSGNENWKPRRACRSRLSGRCRRTIRSDIAKELYPPAAAPALAQTDPMRVAAWINDYTETWFALPSDKDGPQIACRAGCAHCCRIVPSVSDGEAMLLRSAIARLPEATQREIAADVAIAAEAVCAVGGVGGLAWPLRSPLLSRDNRCQVYEDRPGACRAWASADAEACAAATAVADTTPLPLQAVLARASLSTLRGIFMQRVQPLPLALERAGAGNS